LDEEGIIKVFNDLMNVIMFIEFEFGK